MKNILISTKLIILVSLCIIIILYLGVYGISSLGKIDANMKTMYQDRVVPLKQIKLVSDAYAVDIVDVIQKTSINTVTWRVALTRIESAESVIKQEWQAFSQTKMEDNEAQLVSQVNDLMTIANASIQEVSDILNHERDTASIAALEQFRATKLYPSIDPLTKKLNDLIMIQLKVADQLKDDGERIYNDTRLYSIISIVGAIVLALGLSIYIIANINFSLRAANITIHALSQGDLSNDIEVHSRDEIGTLLNNIKLMVDKFKDVIAGVQQASSNIASASQQMSQGSTEQAASAEEVSSSMEEIAASIQQNTDNARQTEKIALKAAEDIKEGFKAVEISVNAMKQIAEKIAVIGEIARKTDLLAINAAIEAARAGEHGKGFAVVASEVRKLAELSQRSANEIDDLSRNSVTVAEKSGKLLGEIVPNIQRTAHLVQEIASASIEQNSGSNQVNDAIQQLNQVTQENAASAEELSGQAEQLLESIEFFRLGKTYTAERRNLLKQRNVAHTLANLNKKSMNHGVTYNLNDNSVENDFEKF